MQVTALRHQPKGPYPAKLGTDGQHSHNLAGTAKADSDAVTAVAALVDGETA